MPTVEDFLLDRINIHVNGPSFPHRDKPLDAYVPLHQSYSRPKPPPPEPHPPSQHDYSLFDPMSRVARTCRLRAIPSAHAKDRRAVVYDKDMVNTWRLDSPLQAYEIFFWEKALEAAVAQEVLGVAIDGFTEGQIGVGSLAPVELLQKFGDFVTGLKTQPVTVPVQNIISGMIDSYERVAPGLRDPFLWAVPGQLVTVLDEFIASQELFFHSPVREPVLEVTFSVLKWHPDSIDVQLYFSWNPTNVHFEDLINVVIEGRDFSMKPTFQQPSNLTPNLQNERVVPTTSGFFVNAVNEMWKEWMY